MDFAAPLPSPKIAKEKTFCEAKMENSIPFKLIVILFAVILCVGKSTEKESNDPLVKAFRTLKEDEKTQFIAYFLALGLRDWAGSQPNQPMPLAQLKPASFIKALHIPSEKIEKFEKLKIPTESVRNLLQWTKSKFNLTTTNVEELLTNKECKGCVRLPDIGGMCCPW